MEGKTVAPIFEYSSLFNTDLSIYDVIKYGFKNSKYFIDGILDLSQLDMIYIFQERTKPNPLTALLKEEYQDSADDLLEEIVNKYGELLYFNTYETDLYRLFYNIIGIEGKSFNIAVAVDNEYQETNLRSMSLNLKNKLRIYKKRDIPLNEYDAIYTDSLFRLEDYSPKVEGKHVFALRNAINTDYDYTLGKYIVQAKFYDMFPKNLFYVVEPYDKLVKIAR